MIDTTRMRVAVTLRLHGAFGLDAIDNAATPAYAYGPDAGRLGRNEE